MDCPECGSFNSSLDAECGECGVRLKAQDCPICDLTNPPTALWCDCGHEFVPGSLSGAQPKRGRSKRGRSRSTTAAEAPSEQPAIMRCRACGFVGEVVWGKRRTTPMRVVLWLLVAFVAVGWAPTCAVMGETAAPLWLVAAVAMAILFVMSAVGDFGKEVFAKCPACLAELGQLQPHEQVVLPRQPQPPLAPPADSGWECNCGTDNRAGAKHCKACGKRKPSTKRKCKQCGAANDRDARFCDECGTDMMPLA